MSKKKQRTRLNLSSSILNRGVAEWNLWRLHNPDIRPLFSSPDFSDWDLAEVNFTNMNLNRANLSRAFLIRAQFVNARLRRTNLGGANLISAVMKGANLFGAILCDANLSNAQLRNAKLFGADLRGANLTRTDLRNADLRGAILNQAQLIETNLSNANLSGCSIYGISAWGTNLEGADQTNLIITPPHTPTITVDNLEVAQFIYLLLNNKKVREVIDTITSKVILILGRFTLDRKIVLDAIRDALRYRNYLPIVFDFEKPANRDVTETISTLAHMARFIIADLTDARSIPQELEAIAPNLPSVPIKPILLSTQHEYAMFEHFRRYPWVLEAYTYKDIEDLIDNLDLKIIIPAERRALELLGKHP